MRFFSLRSLTGLALPLGLVAGTIGCDTGFGKPCKVPQSKAFQKACGQSAAAADADAGAATGTEITLESASSCAVRDYAGCETRVCLVYQGSDAFCSEECVTDDDCEGSARCVPIAPETGNPIEDCAPKAGKPEPECYCVRKGDIADEVAAAPAASGTQPAAGGAAGAGGAAAP